MKKVLLLLSLVLVTVSCVKDIDIDQIEDSVFSVPVSFAFLQLDLDQDDFLDGSNNEISNVFKPFIIDLGGLFYESTSESLDFETQFFSSFDRDISCQLSFYNESNVFLMSSERFFITSSNSPIIYTTTYEGADYEKFTNARRIDVRINLSNGAPISADETSVFSMQSVIHFDFVLEPHY